MDGGEVVALGAALVALVAAGACVIGATLTRRYVRDLRELVDDMRYQAVPLVRDARVVVDQAATEMIRVGEVLGSAEAVSATVDSASRLAYRAFSNPVVKTMAFGSGAGGALRRLMARPTAAHPQPRAGRRGP